MSVSILFRENISEEQRRFTRLQVSCFVKISAKSKKRFTRLQVSCFRENIGDGQKNVPWPLRLIFLTKVSHYPSNNHILPLNGNLPPGWEPLLQKKHLFTEA